MKSFILGLWTDLKTVWKEGDKTAFKGILFTTLILAVYCYFGIHSFFEEFFGPKFTNIESLGYWKYIYHQFTPLLLFSLLEFFLQNL